MKVWDLHCDTLYELRRAEKAGQPKSFAHNDLHIDLEKLQKGDYMLQCFAAFVNLGDKTPGADPLVTALESSVILVAYRKIASAPAPLTAASTLRQRGSFFGFQSGVSSAGSGRGGASRGSSGMGGTSPPQMVITSSAVTA